MRHFLFWDSWTLILFISKDQPVMFKKKHVCKYNKNRVGVWSISKKKTYEPSIYCMSSSANIWVEHKQKLVGGFQPIWKNINSISSSPQVGATIRECCKAPRKSLKPPNRKLSPHRKLSRTPYQSLPVASSQYKRKGLRVEQKQIFHRRMERGSMVLWVKTLLKKNIRIYIHLVDGFSTSFFFGHWHSHISFNVDQLQKIHQLQ